MLSFTSMWCSANMIKYVNERLVHVRVRSSSTVGSSWTSWGLREVSQSNFLNHWTMEAGSPANESLFHCKPSSAKNRCPNVIMVSFAPEKNLRVNITQSGESRVHAHVCWPSHPTENGHESSIRPYLHTRLKIVTSPNCLPSAMRYYI